LHFTFESALHIFSTFVHPTQINSEGQSSPLLDDLIAESPPSIKPQAPKPPKTATIKPLKPPTPEQMRITQLKANVDRQKEALKRAPFAVKLATLKVGRMSGAIKASMSRRSLSKLTG
jgi:hypothetical protein